MLKEVILFVVIFIAICIAYVSIISDKQMPTINIQTLNMPPQSRQVPHVNLKPILRRPDDTKKSNKSVSFADKISKRCISKTGSVKDIVLDGR